MRILAVDYMGSVHYHYHAKEKDPCYSFLLGLRNIVDQFSIDRVLLLLEGGKSKYRLGLYPEYKAQRETNRAKWTEAEQEHYKQFKARAGLFAKDILPMFGMEPVRVWGCEADDIAGYLANHLDLTANRLLMLSSDKDWHQLLRPGVVQGSYAVMAKAGFPYPKDCWMNRSGFEEKYDMPVKNWIWAKCLSGDTGDNVRGFPKVGEATALKLLQKYGSISEIEKNLTTLDIPRMAQISKAVMINNFDLAYKNYSIMNLNFDGMEEVNIFGTDGIDYLNTVIAELPEARAPIAVDSLTELCYENGWIDVLDEFFLEPFEKLSRCR